MTLGTRWFDSRPRVLPLAHIDLNVNAVNKIDSAYVSVSVNCDWINRSIKLQIFHASYSFVKVMDLSYRYHLNTYLNRKTALVQILFT